VRMAPVVAGAVGVGGRFARTGGLWLLAIFVVIYSGPAAPPKPLASQVPFASVLKNRELMRLNYGVFALHVTQISVFVVVPAALVQYADLPLPAHWKVYLPVVLASFALMLPPVFAGEKHGKMKQVFLGAILLMLAVQVGLWAFLSKPGNWMLLVALLLAFFIAFNILEACLPSLVSRIAPPAAKGAALGVYNTLQALGVFCGGALGGWLRQQAGPASVFAVAAGMTVLWLAIAAGMKNLPRRGAPA